MSSVMTARSLMAPIAAAAIGAHGLAGAAPGDLDPTFGGDGRVFIDIAGDADVAATLAQQLDGKLVIGRGNDASTDDFSVLRLDVDGSLDTSFDADGRTSLDFPGVKGTTRVVLLQADGRIVAAGTARSAVADGTNFGLARYNENGSVDTTFGANGVVIHDLGGWADSISAIVEQADGRLVAAGTTDGGASSTADMAFVRFNPDGTLDRSFGTNGAVIINFHESNGYDLVQGLVQQSDGKLVATGPAAPSNPTSSEDMAVLRLLGDGFPDETFGRNGRLVIGLDDPSGQGGGNFASASSLALYSDGRIVLAGNASENVWDYSICTPVLARVNADGSRDTTFGTGGTAWLDLECVDIQHVAIRSGALYVTGIYWQGNRSDHFVARVTEAGRLDRSFGADGVAIIDAGEADLQAAVSDAALIVDSGDNIVTVSSTGDRDSGNTRIMVARLKAGGASYAGQLGLIGPVITTESAVARISVRRTGGSSGTVSIDYATESGTATSGVDFTPSAGTLTWSDGDHADKTIEVSIADDTSTEGSETFLVRLINPSGGASLASSELEVEILDRSTAPPDPPDPPDVPGGPSSPGSGGGGAVDWLFLLSGALPLLRAALGIIRSRRDPP